MAADSGNIESAHAEIACLKERIAFLEARLRTEDMGNEQLLTMNARLNTELTHMSYRLARYEGGAARA